MDKVVDANSLDSPELRAFLAKSQANRAVLTEYTGLEANGGKELSLPRLMAVLGDFPQQVIILKSTVSLNNVHPRRAGLQRRLIHENDTAKFSEFIRRLRRVDSDPAFKRQLVDLQLEANNIKQRLSTYSDQYAAALRELNTYYSQAELYALRKHGRFPEHTTDKVQRVIAEVCFEAINGLGLRRPKSEDELFNLYVFRHVLCWHLLEIERLATGAQSVKPTIHANDIADLHIITCATYFDGILSREKRVNFIHWQATQALQQLMT